MSTQLRSTPASAATDAPSPQLPQTAADATASAAPASTIAAQSETPAAAAGTAAVAELALVGDQSRFGGGTLIPNRVFVGGIPSNATESDLMEFFSAFGNVRDVKIIADKSGLSKGYGFVTFESAEVAGTIIRKDRESRDGLVFGQRRLNIGPAIKKSPLNHRPDPNGNGVFFTAGSVPYTYQNGMAVFHIPGSLYQHYHQQHPQQQLALGGGGGDLQYPAGYGQPYTMTAAAAAAAAATNTPSHGMAQLMCLPAQFAAAVWPNSISHHQQSPSPAQSNTPSSAAYYSTAAFGPIAGGTGLPYYSSPLAANRTPASAYPDFGASGGPGAFLSATSDYGTDPSCTDQSYVNESMDFDCGPLYNQQQHQQQQMAAYSPAPAGYCYGSPPMLCPVRAFPVLLNQHQHQHQHQQPQPQQQLATPPPPAPVARLVSLDSAAAEDSEPGAPAAAAAIPLLQMPLQSMADRSRLS